MCGSELVCLHRSRICLVILTMDSMNLFDWGYFGLECVIFMLYSSAKFVYCSLVNWVPWSDTNSSGSPYSEKIRVSLLSDQSAHLVTVLKSAISRYLC